MRRTHFVLLAAVALLVLAVGCENKDDADEEPSPEALETCEAAGDKYSRCIKEVTGIEQPPNQGNIERCAKSDRTLEMYETCLPEDDCEAFLQCIDDVVAGER